MSLPQRPVTKTTQRIKYILVPVAVDGISFAVIGLLTTGSLMKTENAVAGRGMHNAKVINSANVIVNEFTTLTADVASDTKNLSVTSSSLNANGRFSENLQVD
ncbi:MAG: hypothetical protein ABI855_12725 [Bacteroidota bacterium]